jgi:hypothetical protein
MGTPPLSAYPFFSLKFHPACDFRDTLTIIGARMVSENHRQRNKFTHSRIWQLLLSNPNDSKCQRMTVNVDLD